MQSQPRARSRTRSYERAEANSSRSAASAAVVARELCWRAWPFLPASRPPKPSLGCETRTEPKLLRPLSRRSGCAGLRAGSAAATPEPMAEQIEIRRLAPADVDEQLDALARVLADCVAGGASVSYMAPFSHEDA